MPTVRFVSPNLKDYAESAGFITGTLRLSEASTSTVTVTVQGPAYRSADVDASTQTITFQPGELTKEFKAAIYDDPYAEQAEIYGFKIVQATNASVDVNGQNAELLGYIQANDVGGPMGPAFSISGGGAKSEGSGGVSTTYTFTVTRTGDVGNQDFLSYTTAGSGGSPASADDFLVPSLISGSVFFNIGQTTATISIAVKGDNTVEPDETFAVTLNPSAGMSVTTASATGTITNDDTATAPTNPATPTNPTTPTTPTAPTTPGAGALTTAFTNILNTSPNSAEALLMAGLAAQVANGQITEAQAISTILDKADGTTSVATLAYQFFTGKIPSEAGMAYLISPTGPNPNNLNSSYYQSFSTENRYINFAVNLGKVGEGQQKFAAEYGGLDLAAATTKAYTAIFGTAPTAEKVQQLLTPSFTVGSQTMTRADYFAYYGQDGLNGIGTKAAMVGWLLAEAEKADIGMYSKANHAFLTDLVDGATYSVDLIGTYGQPGFAI
jgi:hypothetical protein